jgi:hypothetical protein
MRLWVDFSHSRSPGLSRPPDHSDAGPCTSLARHGRRPMSYWEVCRLSSQRGQCQLSTPVVRKLADRFGVQRRWRQRATRQSTSRPAWPRAARFSAFSSCPGGPRTVSGTWPNSQPILDAAFSRSDRSEANRIASTNPSTHCSALSGMTLDTWGKSRSFWQATRPCGASRRCCPPKGARLHMKMAQHPSGLPITTPVVQLSPARPAGTTSRADVHRGASAGGRRCRRQLRRRMPGAMTLLARFIAIGHHLPIGVPGSEHGVDGIERRQSQAAAA